MSRSVGRYLIAVVFAIGTITTFLGHTPTYAAQIENRKLTLETGAGGVGGSTPGGAVRHHFTFDLASAGTLGSIKFEYCATASLIACNPAADTDAVTTGATFGSETGSDVTGFSINNTTAGAPYITRTAASVSAGDTVNVVLNNIINPTDVNYTFFVRISTYASTNATGPAIDTGTVAASTADPIVLTGVMPESLIFCTGATIPSVSSVPNCAGATAGTVGFPMLFSPTDTAYTTSQMAASTNADAGYSITYTGPTLTSGSNTINALSTASTSTIGTAQFGMNLKLNTVPVIGSEVTPASDAADLFGQAIGDYATADTYKFVPTTGEAVANSNTSATNSQIYTVSYIVNVPGNQPAGTYVSTITYICTPTF